MKIRVISPFCDKFHTNTLYTEGMVLDFDEERANDVIRRKLGVPFVEEKVEEPVKTEEETDGKDNTTADENGGKECADNTDGKTADSDPEPVNEDEAEDPAPANEETHANEETADPEVETPAEDAAANEDKKDEAPADPEPANEPANEPAPKADDEVAAEDSKPRRGRKPAAK